MNVTDYTYLMNKPDAITEKQADALGSVLNEFPYFQSARALRLKGLYDQNSFKYNYALKVTAAHTTDRSVLFDFITSETFTAVQSDYYDQKLRDLLEIKVFDSEIISPEEVKNTTEVRIDPIEKSILDSIKEANSVIFEETVKTEEEPIDPIIEKSILTSIKEATNGTFEEVKTDREEKVTNTTIEEPILTTIPEESTNISDEESDKPQEKEIETVAQQLTPVKESSIRTFFDETVDDEIVEDKIPEVRIDPIEKSILNSIKESSIVIFEETPINIKQEKEEAQIDEIPESVKSAEESLEIGKPLDFSFNEKHSFQEWLQLSRTEPIDRIDELQEHETIENTVEVKIETETIDEEKKKKAELIDKFIETNPKISPIKQTPIAPAIQIDKEENSYLMTETLARVYLEQKKYTKAIQAYEILILKYPEKISFFADRISDIKILQQNNNNN